MKKIALEEHFLDPSTAPYWLPTMSDVDPAFVKKLTAALEDLGDGRLEVMDRGGVAHAVLGASGPGAQGESDTAKAIRVAQQSNDYLAKKIQSRADRFSGFAHLAVQDAKAAADELERCMRDLKFKGAMINGHTRGLYLDDASLYPFWERAEALGAPIYLHPIDPVSTAPSMKDHKAIRRATWEWGVETGTHALRMVFGGLFDRFPKAKLVLGHMGETLPYLLWRFDSRAKLYGVKLAKAPSQYIKDNIWITNSGMYSAEPLHCAIAALGHERVMFSADYPFENSDYACKHMDEVALDDGVRADITYNNAAKLLGI